MVEGSFEKWLVENDVSPSGSAHRRIERVSSMLIALVCCAQAAGENRDGLLVRESPATGVARFVTAPGGQPIPVQQGAAQGKVAPRDFFVQHGQLFGITQPDQQLVQLAARTDLLNQTHTSFHQVHEGVPVFGAIMRVHTDAQGRIKAVNGTSVADIKVNANPTLTSQQAGEIAIREVQHQKAQAGNLAVLGSKLYVYRTNLARGVPGTNHLVFQVEVGNRADVREFVFVDAHDGRIVDQITGIRDSIDRRVYHGDLNLLIWSEGDGLPYGDPDVDSIIAATEDTYNFFSTLSNATFLSWDGLDGTLHAVHDSNFVNCPNANWNGSFTNFCIGTATDDIIAHEWTHAYTDSTHDLIYQWQSGALNEAYSDIFGEAIDLLNSAGTDSPDVVRAAGDCSLHGGGFPPSLVVNAPAAIAGPYDAGGAAFNPLPPLLVTADVEYAFDGDDEGGAASVNDACQPLVGFTPGNIALIDRGTCAFTVKVGNAEAAGAAGAIVVNNQGDSILAMSGAGSFTIPSTFIGQSDGGLIKAQLGIGVNATIELAGTLIDTYRWLMGEDSSAFGGSIRDMWNPNCFGDPGKVSDTDYYVCSTDDGGGVHTNSGVPNHGFALLVDGGTYNGQTISPVGLTKASHIYWRAQTVYQVPYSDFADHANALEASCADLIGATLTELSTDTDVPSSSAEVIAVADCDEVAKMALAVELRTEPNFCSFEPLLQTGEPALCEGAGTPQTIVTQDWESGLGTWTVGTRNVVNPATFDTPDWAVVTDLPDGRAGSAAFVIDDPTLGNCSDDLETGVLYLESPSVAIPAGAEAPGVAFNHWVATEGGWDGGNLKISVNAGPWNLAPPGAYTFNTYNSALNTAGAGNDNPMAGEAAFTGTNEGEHAGSWGQSQVDLTGIVAPGDSIRLRFEMGLDGCNGRVGWYVDEVQVFNCGCLAAADCADSDACTYDACTAGLCSNDPRDYGDVDGNGAKNLLDVFCILDLIGGAPDGSACNRANADLEPCAGNGALNLLDAFSVLDAIGGIDPCCSP